MHEYAVNAVLLSSCLLVKDVTLGTPASDPDYLCHPCDSPFRSEKQRLQRVYGLGLKRGTAAARTQAAYNRAWRP
jgi:hypothetical protein